MKMMLVLSLLALLVVGCGVNKDYVAQQITDSEARTNAQIADLKDKTDGNAAEVARLRSLSDQLSEKSDMAINMAKGFETFEVIWSGEINFEFDSYDVTGTAESILTEAGEKMEAYPGSVIEIAGFTDRTGSPKYNLMLGQQRADAAKRFLTDRFGISLYRMFLISHGKGKPVAMADEMQASSKNRRVTLKVWGRL